MLIIVMAIASLTFWNFIERMAHQACAFAVNLELGMLLDRLPQLLALLAAAGLASESPTAGVALLVIHHALLLVLTMLFRSAVMTSSNTLQQSRGHALIKAFGVRGWRLICMVATVASVVMLTPALALLVHFLA
ncbi:hypothetical protein ACNFIA_16640 [Pseudomonas sp. NY15437]|uniref:hypothetical protein n=1 Tax=Pseudomonas sp. NY15437 TaxID=3400360 RepID=UPI003A88BB15